MNPLSYDDFRKATKPSKTRHRPSWDEYFMAQALTVATRSACLRRAVGAVIVKDRQLISTGYNGPPAGLDHAEAVGCYREIANIPSSQRIELCRGLHAEQNAIVLGAKKGVSVDGAVLYCTHKPCITCQKMILNAGIQTVKFFHNYEDVDLISKEAQAKAMLVFEAVSSPYLEDLSVLLSQHFCVELSNHG